MDVLLTDHTLRITFAGDLLSTNIDALSAALLQHLDQHTEARAVVADLSRARMIDSKGINLLLALYRETQRRKLALSVEQPTADIRRMLTLLNLNGRLGLTPQP